MRMIKGFIIAITGLFLFITLLSLLMPSTVMTVRSVTIHAGTDPVFSQVADLRNWKHWHPVFIHDSNAVEFSTPSSGANAYAAWNSNGRTNRIVIRETSQGSIKADLIREGEKNTMNIISVTALKDSNHVQAEWRVITKLKWYPWEKFAGIFVDQMTGSGYEAALDNLKQLMESKR